MEREVSRRVVLAGLAAAAVVRPPHGKKHRNATARPGTVNGEVTVGHTDVLIHGAVTPIADATNTGYVNAPGYTSLTTGPTSFSNNTTYSFKSFAVPVNVGTLSTPIDNVTFYGCRFYGAQSQNAAVTLFGGDVTFQYCTIEPDFAAFTPGIFTSNANSYQYSIEAGGAYNSVVEALTMEHCNMWGFGNAVDISGAGPYLFDTCWIHDACTDAAAAYHTDGIGYLNGSPGGLSNMTVRNCRIESEGNTNGIACQEGTYNNLSFTNNVFGGFGYTVAIWPGATNVTFTDNFFSTRLPVSFGPLYSDSFLADTGVLWRRNRWLVPSGAAWGNTSNNNKYWMPVQADSPTNDSPFVSTTDYTG